jgi:hypothetical protein
LDSGKITIKTLHVAGKNGWLSLLYVLMVWSKWIGERDVTDWEITVVDMEWVTCQLCKSTYYNVMAEVISP